MFRPFLFDHRMSSTPNAKYIGVKIDSEEPFELHVNLNADLSTIRSLLEINSDIRMGANWRFRSKIGRVQPENERGRRLSDIVDEEHMLHLIRGDENPNWPEIIENCKLDS